MSWPDFWTLGADTMRNPSFTHDAYTVRNTTEEVLEAIRRNRLVNPNATWQPASATSKMDGLYRRGTLEQDIARIVQASQFAREFADSLKWRSGSRGDLRTTQGYIGHLLDTEAPSLLRLRKALRSETMTVGWRDLNPVVKEIEKARIFTSSQRSLEDAVTALDALKSQKTACEAISRSR